MVHDCGPFGQPGVHAETNHKVWISWILDNQGM